jgi:hypothetical protein
MTNRQPDLRRISGPYRKVPRVWWFHAGTVLGGVAWSYDDDMAWWKWGLIGLAPTLIAAYRDYRERNVRKLSQIVDDTVDLRGSSLPDWPGWDEIAADVERRYGR